MYCSNIVTSTFQHQAVPLSPPPTFSHAVSITSPKTTLLSSNNTNNERIDRVDRSIRLMDSAASSRLHQQQQPQHQHQHQHQRRQSALKDSTREPLQPIEHQKHQQQRPHSSSTVSNSSNHSLQQQHQQEQNQQHQQHQQQRQQDKYESATAAFIKPDKLTDHNTTTATSSATAQALSVAGFGVIITPSAGEDTRNETVSSDDDTVVGDDSDIWSSPQITIQQQQQQQQQQSTMSTMSTLPNQSQQQQQHQQQHDQQSELVRERSNSVSTVTSNNTTNLTATTTATDQLDMFRGNENARATYTAIFGNSDSDGSDLSDLDDSSPKSASASALTKPKSVTSPIKKSKLITEITTPATAATATITATSTTTTTRTNTSTIASPARVASNRQQSSATAVRGMGRSARRGGGVRGGGLSAAAAAAALDRRIAHKDGLGRTRLHKACSKGDCKVALELLQLGADPNARDNALWTPLHEAALNGHSDITRLLLQYGADVNIKGDAGDTALHDACSNGHVDVVKILVNEYKAQVMIGNDTCEKPADVVISPVEEDDEDDVIEKNKARSEILEILLLAGAAPPVSSIDLKQTAADARDAETVSSHSGSTLVTSRTRGNRQSSSTATSTVRQQQQQQQQTTVTTTTTTSRRSARRQQQPVINGNTRRRNARDEDDGMVIADDNDDNVSGSGVDSEGDVSSNGGNSSASDSENESLLSDRTSTNSRRGGKLRHGSSSIASNHSINRSSSNSTHSRRRTAMVDDDEPAGTNYYFTSAEVIPREQRKIMQIAKMIERIENRDARKGQKKGSKPSESQRRSASSRMSRIAAAAAAAGLKPVSAITDRDVDDDNDSDIGNDNGARDDDANISEEPSKSRNQRGDPTIGKRNGGSARSSARASPANSNEKQTASLPSKRSASEFSDRESASASASSKYRRVDSNNNNGAAANSRRTASPVSKRRLIRRGNRGDNDKASDDGVESSNLWSDEADSRKAMPPRKVKLEPDSSSSTTTTAATATTALVNNSGLNSSLERIRGFLPLYTVHLDLSDSNGAARRELFVVDLQIRLMLGMSPFSAPAASGSTSDPLLSRYPKLVRQPVSPSQKNRLWSPFDELMTRVSPSDKTSTADGDWNRPTKPQFCAMPLHFIRLDDLFAIIMTDYPQVCESLNMITVAVDLGYNSSTATGSRSHRSTPEPDSKPVLKAMSNVNLASLSPVKARNIGSVSMPSSPTSIRTTVARLPPKLALKNIQPL